MANEKNLIPNNKRSPSEVRENGRKGGIASGKARNKQKTFKELAKVLLALKPNNEDLIKRAEMFGIDDPDNKELAIIGLMMSAINGNHNAFDRLLELADEKEHTTDEQVKQADLLSAIKKAVQDDN